MSAVRRPASAAPFWTGPRVLLAIALAPVALVVGWVVLCLFVIASPIIAPAAIGVLIYLAAVRPRRGRPHRPGRPVSRPARAHRPAGRVNPYQAPRRTR